MMWGFISVYGTSNTSGKEAWMLKHSTGFRATSAPEEVIFRESIAYFSKTILNHMANVEASGCWTALPAVQTSTLLRTVGTSGKWKNDCPGLWKWKNISLLKLHHLISSGPRHMDCCQKIKRCFCCQIQNFLPVSSLQLWVKHVLFLFTFHTEFIVLHHWAVLIPSIIIPSMLRMICDCKLICLVQ